MSPEGLAHAIERYLESLQTQANAAEHFYFGRLGEAMEAILSLPEKVRERIDALIWEFAKGQSIDPTEPASAELITHAILQGIEERMYTQMS